MTDCISKILRIKDKNIKFEDTLDEKVYKGMTCLFFYGELSYTPPRWALCGYKNKDYSIVKNGKKQSCITLNKMNERPVYLVLAKQRFYCKCCESHFTAKTNVVDMYCYIANSTKLAIVDKATEVR